MKVALALFVKNEAQFILKALDLMLLFDDAFAIDYGSTDGTPKLMADRGVHVYFEEWQNNHGKARQRLVELARERGNDWIVMLDGDERLAIRDMNLFSHWFNYRPSLSFRRINLTPDGGYKREWWPDIQVRGLRLDQNITFTGGPIHAIPAIDGVPCIKRHDDLLIQSAEIEHYALLKPMAEIDLKHINYARIERRQPPLDKLPENHVLGSMIQMGSIPLL